MGPKLNLMLLAVAIASLGMVVGCSQPSADANELQKQETPPPPGATGTVPPGTPMGGVFGKTPVGNQTTTLGKK